MVKKIEITFDAEYDSKTKEDRVVTMTRTEMSIKGGSILYNKDMKILSEIKKLIENNIDQFEKFSE